jgi:hypothetical protein
MKISDIGKKKKKKKKKRQDASGDPAAGASDLNQRDSSDW